MPWAKLNSTSCNNARQLMTHRNSKDYIWENITIQGEQDFLIGAYVWALQNGWKWVYPTNVWSFNDVINGLKALGKSHMNVELVRMIL